MYKEDVSRSKLNEGVAWLALIVTQSFRQVEFHTLPTSENYVRHQLALWIVTVSWDLTGSGTM